MKQKLFTLLTLLLTVCSGAWAYDALSFKKITETTLVYTSPSNLTATGYAQDGKGTQTYSVVSDRGKAMDPTDETSNNYDIGATGTYLKSANSNKEVMLYVTNVTKLEVYCKCNSSNDRYPIITATPSDGTTASTVNGSALNSKATASGKTSLELDETKSYTISIHANDADITLYALRLTAFVQTKTVVSQTITGININGTAWDIAGLSGNAATITDECAGPPTVDFVYVENYDDNTSSSNKTESIVATKDNGSYKAISTVLTNNVTLTFSNVSNVLFSMTEPTAPTSDIAAGGSSAVTATFSPGGSATVYNGHSDNTAQMVISGEININSSGNSYFKASFTSALQEGDVITSSNTTGAFYISSSNNKKNSQTMPYTIPSGSDLIGKKAVYFQKNGGYSFSWVTITRPKTIDTQALGGVKKGETTLTASTDYTVNETTITLADAYKSVIAPTDVKLINHITYDDATTEDEDVDVTLTKNGDFFEGTAAIGTTTYTVKVPVDTTTPLLTLSAASGSINLNSYTPTGTAKVTLTGVNLTNGTLSAPTADGVTVTPATVEITDGTLSQEFTITSTATTAASTVLSFAYTGAETQTYTLSYSKTAKRELTQTDVTGATTWDWTKAGSNTIELNDNTSPTKAEEFLMANLPEVTNDANFNSQALAIVCQFPTRGSNNYFQGNSVKFNTTVPGILDVTFSNTGGNRPYRYLRVNGTQTSFKSGDSNMVEATGIAVPAGEVVIDFYIPDATDPQERSGDVVGTTMCRINKIVFTPATANVTVASTGFTTYVNSTYALNFEGTGITPYVIKANNAESVTLEAKTSVAAGEPVLLYAEGGATKEVPAIASATAEIGNLLVPGEGERITYTDATPYYVLSTEGGVTGFYRANNTLVPEGKAYLNAGTAGARFFALKLDGETTGIDTLLIDNGQLTIDNAVYNLNGQRVMNPAKGLYIVNGRKVVVK